MTLEQAIAFAAACHEGQKDKVGETYILHPLRVMRRVGTQAERRVAVLHDVIEDCGVEPGVLLAKGLPRAEVDAVLALTRGKEEAYMAFVARAGKIPLARRVKLADLADNMDPERLSKLPEERRKDLLEKYTPAKLYLEKLEAEDLAAGSTRSREQVHEGPWLDRLFPVALGDGRRGSVLAFSVLPSNFGILEGGLDARSHARQRESTRSLAEQRYGGPVAEVEPVVVPLPDFSSPQRPRERLPWMACLARLTSAPIDSYMVSSELTLLWWQDAFELPLPQEIERAAADLAWERLAKDVDLP